MSNDAYKAGQADARNTTSPASVDALKRTGMTSDQVNQYYAGYGTNKT